MKMLKIKWEFDAGVLPFIRGDVDRQKGSKLGNG